ncbi:MAG TPA: isoprenylcysteine carboxylmethyltransferase family protein [candidate division Zixibacteria bacterium]|jgi:protein-S-isoprenylcysteine O-methyltransferase Ste14
MLYFKNLLFVLAVPGSVAVYVPLWITRGQSVQPGAWLAVACCLFAAGGSVLLWSVGAFAVFGRATPAPIDAPKRLVVRGLYRYARNPMYVGVLTIIAGWVVLYQTRSILIYWATVAVAFHLFVILYEEPHLRGAFGAEYTDYCKRVGRWLPRG